MGNEQGERRRGVWLTLWLLCLLLVYALVVVVSILQRDPIRAETPEWAVVLYIIFLLINMGALIALWFWRKVGLYICIVVSVPLVILNLLIGIQFLTSFFPLYSLGILWTLLQPRWKYFH